MSSGHYTARLVRPLATTRNGDPDPDALTSLNGPENKARRDLMEHERKPSTHVPVKTAITRDDEDKRLGVVRTTYTRGGTTYVRWERTTELDDDTPLPPPSVLHARYR